MDELIAGLAANPWALVVLAGIVFADAFLVVVPGEVAVTALGSVAAAQGLPPLWAVILVGGGAAFAGDVCCYLIGRLLHPRSSAPACCARSTGPPPGCARTPPRPCSRPGSSRSGGSP